MHKSAGKAVRRSFWRHERGNAAIEFGILAPLLALILLGTVEIGRAVSNNRHFTSTVYSIGDLVAREEYLGTSKGDADTNLGLMMNSIKHLMRPYDPSSVKAAVFSVKRSAKDPSKGTVEWVYNYNEKPNAPAQCSDYTLPSNIVAAGASVIVIDADYTFRSLFGDYVPGIKAAMPWNEKSFHNPRNSCVDYVEGDNCISKC
jgi:Flp pilus assembly protein TadG